MTNSSGPRKYVKYVTGPIYDGPYPVSNDQEALLVQYLTGKQEVASVRTPGYTMFLGPTTFSSRYM